jgi:hypothetical protein
LFTGLAGFVTLVGFGLPLVLLPDGFVLVGGVVGGGGVCTGGLVLGLFILLFFSCTLCIVSVRLGVTGAGVMPDGLFVLAGDVVVAGFCERVLTLVVSLVCAEAIPKVSNTPSHIIIFFIA